MHVAQGTVTLPAFSTEAGMPIPHAQIAYHVFSEGKAWGGKPVVLVEHTLTSSSDIADWWPEIIREGAPLDPREYTIVATTALGSCYGSTFPGSKRPDGRYWGDKFPGISIRDIVHAEKQVLDILGFERFRLIGPSLGGARGLEWCYLYPKQIQAALIIATSARSSAWQIGIQSSQIKHIENDLRWNHGNYYFTNFAPVEGLEQARRLAHLTYRGELELDERFGTQSQPGENPFGPYRKDTERFAIDSYLDAQAQKFIRRFDAGSYVSLTDALNRHDIGRNRGGIDQALSDITVPVSVVGVDTDILYPFHQQEHLARNLGNVLGLDMLTSPNGHDAFLLEHDQMGRIVREFLDRTRKYQLPKESTESAK